MTIKRATHSTLDRVLSALEKEILRASDEEILQETKGAKQQAQRVRALVSHQISLRSQPVPQEPRARRHLVAELIRARPSLAPALSATFSGRNAPSDKEVDELIQKLLKRGVLRDKKR